MKRLKDKPFALVGVNSDPADRVAGILREQGIGWRNAVDGGTRGPLSSKWNIRAWPTVFVLDAKGVIRHVGINAKDVDGVIDRLLKE